MKLACWNVNSIRAREARVLSWLEQNRPDVVCLQELKVQEEAFPYEALRALGYHAVVHGQRAYNGVAVLSLTEPTDPIIGLDDAELDHQSRVASALVEGVRVISVYVPNGAAVGSDKYAFKLAFLGRLRRWLEARFTPETPLVVCGDFNVAPEPRDVRNPERWEQTVLCHPEVRRALTEVTDWGLVDCVRLHHDGDGPYTWWDYRMLGFPKNDGLRIDHVFATRPVAERCTAAWVDREERKGPKPSDHAPVVVEFN